MYIQSLLIIIPFTPTNTEAEASKTVGAAAVKGVVLAHSIFTCIHICCTFINVHL